MPMVMVSPRVYEQSRGLVEPVMADLRKRYALTGLGLDCQYDPEYDTYVGDCGYKLDKSGSPIAPTKGPPGSNAWTEAMLGLTKVFGQAYLNEHQAKLYTSGPGGTTFYQQSGVALPVQNVGIPGGVPLATGAGIALGSMPWLMIAGGAVVLVMVMSRR